MFAITQGMFHPIHGHSGTLQFAAVQTGSSVLTAFNCGLVDRNDEGVELYC